MRGRIVHRRRWALNYYGSTEVAADVTAHRVSPAAAANTAITIGAPLAGVEPHILDDACARYNRRGTARSSFSATQLSHAAT
ncbi:hypothetical protein CLV40_10810 [Actinokineospora auranticolor]|uniref:AMP-binding enzyme n=1 Tax=Actinokineospora auranticolor TaxID=155976 RepID=A0A2S6GP51_9PSEU|nr:hypothetical protein CLV40_10810 [Actinokineospora auranticolor]